MSVKRTIIIPAILTLSAAGSVLAGSAVSLATATATAVVAAASFTHPDYLYQG
jgi:alcohol dehydrogenase YqhD (iron-dependent ADH family)